MVLNAFSPVLFGSFAWISAAAELPAGTVSESKVSKFSGFVMSTNTLPSRRPAYDSRMPWTAG